MLCEERCIDPKKNNPQTKRYQENLWKLHHNVLQSQLKGTIIHRKKIPTFGVIVAIQQFNLNGNKYAFKS